MTLDANTIVTGIVGTAIIGMSGWTLLTIHDLAKKQSADHAAAAEREKSQDQKINENRARIMRVEEKVGVLEVDVGRLQPSRKSAH